MKVENLDEANRPADSKTAGDKMEKITPTAEQNKEPSGDNASRRPKDKNVEQDGDDNAKIGNVGTKTEVDEDGQRDATLAPEKSAKTVKKVMEAFAENVPSFTLSEELGSLLESEDLSEDFRNKAVTVIESAINLVLEAEHSKMVERFGEVLEETLELQEAEIEDRVQKYVDYVATEWVNENQLAIEHGIKNDINESVVSEIIEVLEKHNIKLDEAEIDIVEEERLARERAETALEESIDTNSDLKESLAESQKLLALVHFSRENSLTMVEEEKLFDLAKNTVFESKTQFSEKLETLKENYFAVSNKGNVDTLTEDLHGDVPAEEVITEKKHANPDMERYVKTFRSMSSTK